ncbi:hypothetical protein BAE44_0005859, partial [Dichanthelium oligosanthes]
MEEGRFEDDDYDYDIVGFRETWDLCYAGDYDPFEATIYTQPKICYMRERIADLLRQSRPTQRGRRSPLAAARLWLCGHKGLADPRRNLLFHLTRDNCQILTQEMKALSLIKVRAAGGGEGQSQRRRRRRHRRHSPDAGEPRDKDAAAASASSSASSSAKIASAQPHEADGDREDPLHPHEKREQGGAKHEHCDKCCSPLDGDHGGGAGDEEEAAAGAADGDREWAAEPEPG